MHLISIRGRMLLWLKYMKKIWPHIDTDSEKGNPHRLPISSNPNKIRFWEYERVLKPFFEVEEELEVRSEFES